MSLNKVLLIGNVGKDPEVRHLENGSMVARFSLATTERFKDKNGEFQEQTEWHNIVCWRSLAERVEKYVKKGSQLFIEGKIRPIISRYLAKNRIHKEYHPIETIFRILSRLQGHLHRVLTMTVIYHFNFNHI